MVRSVGQIEIFVSEGQRVPAHPWADFGFFGHKMFNFLNMNAARRSPTKQNFVYGYIIPKESIGEKIRPIGLKGAELWAKKSINRYSTNRVLATTREPHGRFGRLKHFFISEINSES